MIKAYLGKNNGGPGLLCLGLQCPLCGNQKLLLTEHTRTVKLPGESPPAFALTVKPRKRKPTSLPKG